MPSAGRNQRIAARIEVGDRVVIDGVTKTVTEFGGYAPYTRLVFDNDPYDWRVYDMLDPIDLAEEH
jgi:hypothetical protein